MRHLVVTGAIAGIVVLATVGAGWATADHGSLPTTDLKREAASGQAGAAYTLGMRYYDENGHHPDYQKAVHWLAIGAKAGDARAQAQLGYMYQEGSGVPRDYALARQWAGRAAAQGDAAGMNQLGDLYLHGLGVKRNYVTARSWFEKSAAKGNSTGMANLGWVYFYGLGVPKDCKKAVGYYQDSIRQDDPSGENNMAVAHFFGCGATQSDVAALKWALIANKSVTATPAKLTPANRRRVLRNIANLEQRMTPAEIAKAKDEAAQWRTVP